VTDPSEYARQIETYLCQKNKGHLIRVVGPAFELVCGWAASGVPLKVAFLGIDRCCGRHEKKGARPRPVRLEFCEADVLDAFDDWRRAVGVGAAGDEVSPPARKPALAAHIERAIARLAHVRGAGPAEHDLHRQIEQVIGELEPLAASALRARGDARAAIVARLAEIDAALMAQALAHVGGPRAEALRREAAEEVAPFGARMSGDVRERAAQAAYARLVREAIGLPTLGYD
jgi:hypothetical protein